MKIATGFMGFLKAILGLVWIGLLVFFFVYGRRGLGWTEKKLSETLATTNKNFTDINALLFEIVDVMDRIDQSLGTIEEATTDASISLSETRPILDDTSTVLVEEIPDALDEVQDAMPGVIEAAAVIDDAMTILSKFNYQIPKPFSEDSWVISLGVDYHPVLPLDQALQNLSEKLESIPDELRGIEDDLNNAKVNLAIISGDLMNVASDLESIKGQVDDINPQIEIISDNLSKAQESMERTKSRIPQIVDVIEKWFMGVMILGIVSQIPSVYFGLFFMRSEKSGLSAKA
jgi:septation ring formation regulator EzrA